MNRHDGTSPPPQAAPGPGRPGYAPPTVPTVGAPTAPSAAAPRRRRGWGAVVVAVLLVGGAVGAFVVLSEDEPTEDERRADVQAATSTYGKLEDITPYGTGFAWRAPASEVTQVDQGEAEAGRSSITKLPHQVFTYRRDGYGFGIATYGPAAKATHEDVETALAPDLTVVDQREVDVAGVTGTRIDITTDHPSGKVQHDTFVVAAVDGAFVLVRATAPLGRSVDDVELDRLVASVTYDPAGARQPTVALVPVADGASGFQWTSPEPERADGQVQSGIGNPIVGVTYQSYTYRDRHHTYQIRVWPTPVGILNAFNVPVIVMRDFAKESHRGTAVVAGFEGTSFEATYVDPDAAVVAAYASSDDAFILVEATRSDGEPVDRKEFDRLVASISHR